MKSITPVEVRVLSLRSLGVCLFVSVHLFGCLCVGASLLSLFLSRAAPGLGLLQLQLSSRFQFWRPTTACPTVGPASGGFCKYSIRPDSAVLRDGLTQGYAAMMISLQLAIARRSLADCHFWGYIHGFASRT